MKTTPTMVLFWRTAEIYSNWHPAVFKDEFGVTYANAEQYLMYHKALVFNDQATAERMRSVSDPKALKALGRMVQGYDDATWEAIRLEVMVKGCYLKFAQNAAMGAELLATGDRTLVEASPEDRIWGIGLEESDFRCLDPNRWLGRNLLGEALMQVRAQLRQTAR